MPDKEEVRIGVFVCHCGSNIAGYINIDTLVEYAKTLPNVAFVQPNLYTCSEGGINEIKKSIKAENLNRVVVASCTPRTHEPLFRSACAEAGLNPYLFEMVNIRDQCSWVHMQQKEEGTHKAADLIRMGVAKAAALEPLQENELSITRGALVIGGGIAGMSAATSLARMGYRVYLVEKQDRLGGMLNNLGTLAPGHLPAADVVAEKIGEVKALSGIDVRTSSTVTALDGYIGNFRATIETGGKEDSVMVGVVVVAIGADVLKPEGYYKYDGQRVISQFELEGRLRQGLDESIRSVVMIQCVGARSPERKYCSRICCQTAVKNAMLIREANPKAHVSILYRDMQMYGVENETLFRQAKAKGVRFMYYDPKQPPEVGGGHVKVFHQLMGKEMDLPADLVTLSTPLVARPDADPIAKLLRVPLDENKFFLEGHVKLKPLDFATDGVFLCGSCRYPANVREAVAQGLGAASRAATLLSKEKMFTSGIVARINDETCIGCQGCQDVCPYQAIWFDDKAGVCKVNSVLCKGCGACSATCPSGSAQLKGFTSKQLMNQIDEVLAA